jgi:acyl dehydratase
MNSGLQPQQVISVHRRMSARMIRQFGELIGDLNPQHVAGPGGAKPIVHGLYLASAVSTLAEGIALLGRRFSMEFIAPAYADDEIEVTVTVDEVRPIGSFGDRVRLSAVYRNQDAATLAHATFEGLAFARTARRLR